MQINEYKPDVLNLTEFIDLYRISMILNNELIKTGSFELYNYNEMLEDEKINYADENKEEIISYYLETRETAILKGGPIRAREELNFYLAEAEEEFINDNIQEIEENLLSEEIYQYFIISESDLNTIEKYLNYPIYYSDELDIYLLGITHWGMSWSFFFTEAPRPAHMRIKKYDEILSGKTTA